MWFLKAKPFYAMLLLLAASLNASGYLLNLWREETLFDEAAHLFTTFAGMAALGRAFLTRTSARPSSRLAILMVILALILGVAWECFEWIVGIIGNERDTIIDLLMDLAGAVLAALLIKRLFETGVQPTPGG